MANKIRRVNSKTFLPFLAMSVLPIMIFVLVGVKTTWEIAFTWVGGAIGLIIGILLFVWGIDELIPPNNSNNSNNRPNDV